MITVYNDLNSERLEHVEQTKACEAGTSQKMAYTLS